MKKFLLVITAIVLFIFPSFTQKLVTVKGHCGLYYKSMNDLYKQKAGELKFYQFAAGQHIASIGAQCCHWEAAYAATTDSAAFYLEDIDSAYFNQQQADFAWNYYGNARKKPMTCTYKLVIGNEKQTNLPENIFDKILIINSFHEFGDQSAMLADIAGKLKPGGLLYIDETLARETGELHRVCGKRIFLDEELIGILKENGYEYIDGLVMSFRNSKPARKIFSFRKSDRSTVQ